MYNYALKPSKQLKVWLMAIHALAILSCFANALPFGWQMLLASALVGHGYWFLQKKLVWRAIRYSEALGWEIANSGEFVEAKILPDTVITTFALFLHVEITAHHTYINGSFMSMGKRRSKQSIMLLPDSLAVDGYRSLIVKLKTTYKIKGKSSNLLIESH